MELTSEVRQAHADLSGTFARFLDFVEHNPDCVERAHFEALAPVEEAGGYPMQSWPLFISRRRLAELYRLNVELCHLVKTVPHRLFGNDPGKLAEFYRLEPDHAQLVVASYANPRWIRETISRSDFIGTADGWRALEYNIASRISGWQSAYAGDTILAARPIARFVEETGIHPKNTYYLHALMAYLLQKALRRLRTSEVNVVILIDKQLLAENAGGFQRMFDLLHEHHEQILKALGGKVRGRLWDAKPEELEERGGMLYHGDRRVHVLVDGGQVPGVDAIRCWVKGTVDMYNGPATPVFSDKRNLALLSELQDTPLITDQEREVLRAGLPWTRRVGGERLLPEAPAPVARDELLARREELVVKSGGGSSGWDVYIGKYTDAAAWREVVDRALDDGTWIAQERQISRPYLFQRGDVGCEPHDLIWGIFLNGENPGGILLRVQPRSVGGVVNSTQGAAMCACLEVEEPG